MEVSKVGVEDGESRDGGRWSDNCKETDLGWTCTRPPLHSGDHAAYGTGTHPIHRWANTTQRGEKMSETKYEIHERVVAAAIRYPEGSPERKAEFVHRLALHLADPLFTAQTFKDRVVFIVKDMACSEASANDFLRTVDMAEDLSELLVYVVRQKVGTSPSAALEALKAVDGVQNAAFFDTKVPLTVEPDGDWESGSMTGNIYRHWNVRP